MKLIVDTNILVSALVFGGTTKRHLDLILSEKNIAVLISDETVGELKDTLFSERFRKFRAVSELTMLFDFYVKSSCKIPISETFDLCRDPKDNKFLDGLWRPGELHNHRRRRLAGSRSLLQNENCDYIGFY